MSTVLVSQNGLGLEKSPQLHAGVQSVGFLNGQAGFADPSCSSVGKQEYQ
jgi:hypothetical protein